VSTTISVRLKGGEHRRSAYGLIHVVMVSYSQAVYASSVASTASLAILPTLEAYNG